MGQTVVSPTMQSHTIGNDDDVDVKAAAGAGVASVAFNSFGTTPILRAVEGGAGRVKVKVTSGSGTPAIAANNVVLTLVGGRTPRKVYLASSVAAPGFHVASVGANTVTLGTKVAPAASTQYDLDLIVLF
jgi:hypothetical protein